MSSTPTPQRALRAARATRPAPRMRNSPEHRAWLARHLTDRDRWLMRMLFEHKVFTSTQIMDMAFTGRRTTNLRLHNLYNWGIVYRFQPHRESGSYPMHYVLDAIGATVLAHEHGLEASALNYNRERTLGRAYSLQLAHDVACNSLFTSLIHHGRQPNAAGTLTAWWSAARCARLWGDIVKPDGYGRWHQTGHDIEWFTEYDAGTEQLSRLTTKLHRYARLAGETRIATPVLFWFPTARREISARNALADTLTGLSHPGQVPTATTSTGSADQPLDMSVARWSRVGPGPVSDRVRLADLPRLWPDLPAPEPASAKAGRSPDLDPPVPMPPLSGQPG